MNDAPELEPTFEETTGDEAWTAAELRRLERARLARDPRFDGTFFIGVVTTGIYCRPVCPATPPKPQNVRYYRSAAGAAAAGFRPCLRCRPEASPGTPAWLGTSATVSRALRLIDEGALDDDGGGSRTSRPRPDDGRRRTEAFANRLGLGERHLRRLFERHLGASPAAVARTRRVHFARRLLEESALKIADVAFASGFGSLRAFNEAFRAAYATTPRQVRARRGGTARPLPAFTFRLGYRPPGDWPGLLAYLAPRAMSGVESVDGDVYARLIRWQGAPAVLEVAPVAGASSAALQALELRLHAARPDDPPSANRLLELVARVRRMFDLGADPTVVARVLRADPLLATKIRRFPGVRLPVAWDPFELAVRAILGQQVSVAAASTLAGRLVARFGEPLAVGEDATSGSPRLRTLFPTPERLADEDLGVIGLPRARAEALRSLARAVAGGTRVFDAAKPLDELVGGLCELPGVGPWTAHYVALRGLGVPDAFPAGDLGLRRALRGKSGALPSATEVAARAETWRPWRGYGALLLWREAA